MLALAAFELTFRTDLKIKKKHYFSLIKSLKTASGLRPSILADISGPKIRVKSLKEKLSFSKGDSIVLSNDKLVQGAVSISKGVRFEKINPGARISLASKPNPNLSQRSFLDVLELFFILLRVMFGLY